MEQSLSELAQQLDNRLLEALKIAKKNNDKQKILQILSSKEKKFKLNKILLPEEKVELAQAKRDIIRENIIFNGVKFFGYPQLFLTFLAEYVRQLTSQLKWDQQRASQVEETILCKASRTASGYNSYFLLSDLFQTDTCLLKPRYEPTPPIVISMLLIDGALLCRIATKNIYGLYRMEDIDDPNREDDAHPEPWLRLDAEVFENIDFTKQKRWVRFMKITSPDIEGSNDLPRVKSKSRTPKAELQLAKTTEPAKFYFFKDTFACIGMSGEW